MGFPHRFPAVGRPRYDLDPARLRHEALSRFSVERMEGYIEAYETMIVGEPEPVLTMVAWERRGTCRWRALRRSARSPSRVTATFRYRVPRPYMAMSTPAEERRSGRLDELRTVVVRAFAQARDDRITTTARALAYSLFLAIPAVLLVVLGVLLDRREPRGRQGHDRQAEWCDPTRRPPAS